MEMPGAQEEVASGVPLASFTGYFGEFLERALSAS